MSNDRATVALESAALEALQAWRDLTLEPLIARGSTTAALDRAEHAHAQLAEVLDRRGVE